MTEDELALCERVAARVGVKVRRMMRNVTQTGLQVVDDDHGVCDGSSFFDPFVDDAQAFRIAMVRSIWIEHAVHGVQCGAATVRYGEFGSMTIHAAPPDAPMPQSMAAMRRAIVLAVDEVDL